MALSILKGLVTNYGRLGYHVWHRPLKIASLVYGRELGRGEMSYTRYKLKCYGSCLLVLYMVLAGMIDSDVPF